MKRLSKKIRTRKSGVLKTRRLIRTTGVTKQQSDKNAETLNTKDDSPNESLSSAANTKDNQVEQNETEQNENEENETEQNETEQDEGNKNELSINDDVRFPLVSSFIHGDKVKTTGLLVSHHGCNFLYCDATPKLNVGLDTAAPYIAAIHRKMLRRMGSKETQRKVAEAFVIRARQGDQNAMAIMRLVVTNAKRGYPLAKQSLQFMRDYVSKNPVKANSNPFGDDCVPCMKVDMNAVTGLANGPTITNPRIRNVYASFGADKLFLEGFKKWQSKYDKEHEKLSMQLDSIRKQILLIGRTIGHAVALQKLRNGGPIMAYDKNIAWELGEL